MILWGADNIVIRFCFLDMFINMLGNTNVLNIAKGKGFTAFFMEALDNASTTERLCCKSILCRV